MARDLEDSEYYVSHGGMIPLKWTAPEVGTWNTSHHLLLSILCMQTCSSGNYNANQLTLLR